MTPTLEDLRAWRTAISELRVIVEKEGYTMRSWRYRGTPLHRRLRFYLLFRQWFG